MAARTADHEVGRGQVADWAPWSGLGAALVLAGTAVAVPLLTGWQVYSHAHPSPIDVAPLHTKWAPKVGPGTVPAVLRAVVAVRHPVEWADVLRWRTLLTVSYVGGLAWLLSLAYVDGNVGLSRVLGNGYEYLGTARATHDVPRLLHKYVARIPLGAADHLPTHVAGHPPGAVLAFVVLDRVGLSGDWVAGLVVTVLAASTPLAVLLTLRVLGAEPAARRAAPFLVLGPAAVWTAVCADALLGVVAAWGLCALAVGATQGRGVAASGWSALAGLLPATA